MASNRRMTLSERLGGPKPKTHSQRAQEKWYKDEARRIWKQNRQQIVQLLRNHINRRIPGNTIHIEQSDKRITVDYFNLRVMPDKIGFRVEWTDRFGETHQRKMNTLEKFEDYLLHRAREDWLKVSEQLDSDIVADVHQSFVDKENRRDIRWSVVGLVIGLLIVAGLILLVMNTIG